LAGFQAYRKAVFWPIFWTIVNGYPAARDGRFAASAGFGAIAQYAAYAPYALDDRVAPDVRFSRIPGGLLLCACFGPGASAQERKFRKTNILVLDFFAPQKFGARKI
jgi:hypothetical protein